MSREVMDGFGAVPTVKLTDADILPELPTSVTPQFFENVMEQL